MEPSSYGIQNIRFGFYPSCQKPDKEYSTTTGFILQEEILYFRLFFII